MSGKNGRDEDEVPASRDIAAHNRESLEALVAHVDEQCRTRVDEIERRAREQADRIRQSARDKAADLLREVRRRERRNLHESVRVERARQQGRIRQRELSERRAAAEKGLEYVRSALVSLWQDHDDGARATWLERALADARAVMTVDDWVLRHPGDWSPEDAAVSLAERIAEGARIDWRPDPDLTEGFVVSAAGAVVDATPAGLCARGDRIAGVLLATLPALDSEVES